MTVLGDFRQGSSELGSLMQLNKNCVLCSVRKPWQQTKPLQRLDKSVWRLSERTERSSRCPHANRTHRGDLWSPHRRHVLDTGFTYQSECPAVYDSSRPVQSMIDCGDVFIYLQILCGGFVGFFFPRKLCIPLSIPSKMLDAKSPQGMCQHLLNTLCTLLLILHCCGFTVGEMQMAAHGIALWGNKGNTAYFSNAGFIFPAFVDSFTFFCCMDNFSATISRFTCLRHSFSTGRNFFT